MKNTQGGRKEVIEISTDVFRVLQQQAPGYVSPGEEKPGPTQKILVEEDVYTELIDRAIAHRQTLDQVVLDACTRMRDEDVPVKRPDNTRQRSRRRFQ
jgi:hypothetical protein